MNKEIREIRINPVVPGESVLVATARSMRPKEAEEQVHRDGRKHVETCPFCSGNEDRTPPAIGVYPGSENWAIRIVENLYPVLGDEKAIRASASACSRSWTAMAGMKSSSTTMNMARRFRK